MPRLWGREQERRLLHGLVDSAAHGRGAAAMVEGEPGIGKTRLLDDATTYARQAGCQVRSAATDPMLGGRPFALLRDAFGIRPMAADAPAVGADAEIAMVAGLLSPTHPGHPDLEFAVVDRLVDLVERLAAGGPLVLVCEDLQWADQSSLRVLYRIARVAASTPVLLLLSRRPAPIPPGLAHLQRLLETTGSHRFTLGPLPPPQARAMAADRLGAALDENLAGLVARANGNPLLIEELIDLIRGPSPPGAAPDTLPASVADPLLAKVSWVDESAVEVLRAATVLGTPFRLVDLALVTGQDVPALLGLLRDPVSLGVLTAHGDGYTFRHDLVREAVYQAMSEPVRAAWHIHVGRMLGEAGRDPLTVAFHFDRGASAGDPEAPRWLARAAEATRAQAPATASELLDRAVALTAASSPDRTLLRLAQLEARVDAGPLPEAVTLGEQLLSEHLPGVAVPVRRALAEARMAQGRFAEAAAQLAPVLAGGTPDPDSGPPAHLRAWHAYLRAWSEPDAVDGLVEAACADADRTGDPDTVVYARLADAIRLLFGGYFAGAADRAEAAAAVLRQRFDAGEAVRLVPPVICHFAARRFDSVRQLFNHPLWADRARQQSQRHAMLASMHYLSGEWDDALATADTLATLAVEQDRERDRRVVPWVRILVALGRGHLEQVDTELAFTEPIVEFQCLRAALVHARGRVDEARAIVAAIRDEVLAPPEHRLTIRPLWPVYLPLCLAVHERDTAENVVAVVTEIAQRADTTSTTAEGLHARGLVDDDAEALLAAAAAYRDTPLAVERAACQEAAGVALAGRGHRNDATAQLQGAVEAYEQMGAIRHVARAEAALRDLGVRRGRRGPRRRPVTGWDSLTPTELSVAALVAEGLIYREIAERLFISRRTVETHVAHMFAKLGVKSRSELAALARARIR
jgi:DNA-binding CsgD family transcriptional regulator